MKVRFKNMATTIRGIHHVTAITSSAPKIWDFFTNQLGLHLIKKSVNQDDVRTYHLYFSDDQGDAGSILTFFDFPGITKATFGTNEISRTTFRVPSQASFSYWRERFDHFGIRYDAKVVSIFGATYLNFYDFDGQRYALVADDTNPRQNNLTGAHHPWRHATVAPEHAIIGLGPAFLTINDDTAMRIVLTKILDAKQIDQVSDDTLYEFDQGGYGAQVITHLSRIIPSGTQGYGTVHHLAFTVDNEAALKYWIDRLKQLGMHDSGFVDRFYFKSEYFRPMPGMLFELATNGPGFLIDETYEAAGIHLELPPFLEGQRADIEAHLVDFNSPKAR